MGDKPSDAIDELTARFPSHAVMATLQCAGNRRTGFNRVREIVGEDPWGPGATSTAEGRGARLKGVLHAAGVTPHPWLHVALEGPDVSALARSAQPNGGSIPLSKAMSDEVLLAWGMNCQPLPRIHGGPVRLIVPGYTGARSVKWITSLTVQTEPSDNYFQASAYRILPADADADPNIAEPRRRRLAVLRRTEPRCAHTRGRLDRAGRTVDPAGLRLRRRRPCRCPRRRVLRRRMHLDSGRPGPQFGELDLAALVTPCGRPRARSPRRPGPG